MIQPPSPFASGGDIRRVAVDGTHTLVASLGDSLAGITVAKDGPTCPSLGDGTTIVKVPTNHRGAKLIR